MKNEAGLGENQGRTMRSVLCSCAGGVLIPATDTPFSLRPSLFMCILVINFFYVSICVPLLRFRVAQIDVWSFNFLLGLKVEIRQGWALFGLDLKRGAGMVWEQLTRNFSVGERMFAMLR